LNKLYLEANALVSTSSKKGYVVIQHLQTFFFLNFFLSKKTRL